MKTSATNRFFHTAVAWATVLAIVGLSATIVREERRNDYAMAETTVLNTADIVARQVENSFDSADELIKTISLRYRRNLVRGQGAVDRLSNAVKQEVPNYKLVSRIGISDAKGVVVFNSAYDNGTTGRRPNISDRGYFKQARAGERRLLFSGPLRAKLKGEWSLFLARRIDDDRGRFLGVVFAVLPIDGIGKSFSQAALGPGGIINLRTADFAQVVRYPALTGPNADVGNRNVSRTILSLMREKPGRDHYVYTTVAPIDGVERVYSYKKFDHSPFWMTVGRATADFTPSWHRNALTLALLSLVMSSAVIWGARRIILQNSSLERRIEEKDAAEQKLRDNEEKLSTILDSLESCVYLKDTEGRYLYANAALRRLRQVELDELVGCSDDKFFDAGTAARIRAKDRRVLDGGEVLREEETFIAAATGEAATYLCVKLPLRREDGTIHSLCGVATDITERIRTEDEIRKSREFLQKLADNLPVSIGYWSRDLICLFANRNYREWFGKNPEQMPGISARDFVGDSILSYSKPYIDGALQGIPQQFERETTKANGETVTAWVNYIPDMVQDEVRGFFLLVSDITDIRKSQKEKDQLSAQLLQSQKMESIGQLAGGVAHDFNNILTVISGYCTLLENDKRLDEQQTKRVAEISAAADKAAQLTHGLLAFSRKQPMIMRDENLNDIVQHIHKFLARIIGEDINFNSTCCGTELPVRADRGQLEQALINLATNARDAMPNGGTFTVRTDLVTLDPLFVESHNPDIPPGSYALLTVSDNGTGIDKNNLGRIFEPFFTTKEVGKGTGLGMSIIYGIVRQHKGFINVYSEVGRGTTLRIYLPLQESQGRTPAVKDEAVAAPVGGGETILIAEDDQSVRALVAEILTRYGYQVLLTRDGNEALAQFAAGKDAIDLVLMDMIMPGKNGMDVYHEIRRIRPHTKVIFSSGYTSDFLEKHGVADNDIQLLMKPVQPVELLRKVREVLDA